MRVRSGAGAVQNRPAPPAQCHPCSRVGEGMWAAPAIRWRFDEVGERTGGREVPTGVRIGWMGSFLQEWNRSRFAAFCSPEGLRVEMRVRTRTSSGDGIRPELERRKHPVLSTTLRLRGLGQGAYANWPDNLQNYGARRGSGDAVRDARWAITNPSACERYDTRSNRSSGRASCRPCSGPAHSGAVSSDPRTCP